MRYLNAVFCTDTEIKNWNINVKVLNVHDVIITSKWRHKVVKLRNYLQYSDYLIMRNLNAVFCTDTEIKNWNIIVKVLNVHDVIITPKWRHKVVKLRHSLQYSDYLIMRYMTSVFCTGWEIKNWNMNVKVLNDPDVIIKSKWRHKVVKLRNFIKYNDDYIMTLWYIYGHPTSIL